MNKKIFKYLNIEISRAEGSAGFVILFAVTISAILLAVAIGVANIAFKEVKFGTNARDTGDAFFAADTGIECALNYDKSDPAKNAFTGTASISCAGSAVLLSGAYPVWTFVVVGIGSTGQSCASVVVDKTLLPTTTIISKGYNIGDAICSSSNPDRVERELKITY